MQVRNSESGGTRENGRVRVYNCDRRYDIDVKMIVMIRVRWWWMIRAIVEQE